MQTERTTSMSNEHSGSLGHNNRVKGKFSGNVDKERTKNNVTIVKQTLDEAYDEVFGEAVNEYNAKQKRADRKIKNYYDKLFKEDFDKRGVEEEKYYDEIFRNKNKQYNFYEYVVGVGDSYDTAIIDWTTQEQQLIKANPKCAELATKCLKEYIEKFEERNPNFHVFNAVIHLDEKTPHLHYDFIPFADGCKNGMSRQQSMSKALSAMGYGEGKQAIANFTASERKVFRKICEENGFTLAEEQQGRGYSFSSPEYRKAKESLRKSLTPEVQKEVDENLANTKSELATTRAELENTKSELEQQKRQAVLNAIDIPPRPKEKPLLEYPPKPKEPIYSNKEYWKDYKAECKEYKKKCSEIDKQNAKTKAENADVPRQQAEWDRIQGTLQIIKEEQERLDRQQKSVNKQLQQADEQEKALISEKQAFEAEKKAFNSEKAQFKIKAEIEVQKRTAPNLLEQTIQQHQGYVRRSESVFAEFEQKQAEGQAEMQKKQEYLEKIKNKTTQKGKWER